MVTIALADQARDELTRAVAAPWAIELARVVGGQLLAGPAGFEYRAAVAAATVPEAKLQPSLHEGTSRATPNARHWRCALPDFAVLQAIGPDAEHFLQSQLTNDLSSLTEQAPQLNGYCTPKGRLLATAWVWREAEGLSLLVPSAHAPSLLARLRKYVMRAKLELRLAEELAVLGLADFVPPAGGAQDVDNATEPDSLESDALEPNSLEPDSLEPDALESDRAALATAGLASAARLVCLPSVEALGSTVRRTVLLVPKEAVTTVWRALEPARETAATEAWRWLELLAGTPRIVGGAVEQFVPQMINLERVGGVSFKKGCYPGQEVVARSQYLGKLKRRMFLALSDGPLASAGDDVVLAGSPEPVGRVVLAASHPVGLERTSLSPQGPASTQLVLFEAPSDVVVEQATAGRLRLAHQDGPILVCLLEAREH